MTCPDCTKEINEPALPVGPLGRRHTTFIVCSCSTVVRLISREGWNRWYATHKVHTIEAAWETATELPGKQAYLNRETSNE